MHRVWKCRERQKGVVDRYIRLYLDEFYDRSVIDKVTRDMLIKDLMVVFNLSTDGTNNDSVMLANTVVMNWVEGYPNLQSNCFVLSQEVAHYVLWKLKKPHSVWDDMVHTRWHSEHSSFLIEIRFWSWRYMRRYRINLFALNVFDLV